MLVWVVYFINPVVLGSEGRYNTAAYHDLGSSSHTLASVHERLAHGFCRQRHLGAAHVTASNLAEPRQCFLYYFFGRVDEVTRRQAGGL